MQTASQWNDQPYLVYLPDHYSKAQNPLPLIVFLHGIGERGTDTDLILKHGLPALLNEDYWSPSADIEAAEAESKWMDYGAVHPDAPEDPVDTVADHVAGIVSFPFIVLSPQCPEDRRWSEYMDETLALLDHFTATYNVDPARVYLTGFSMGGHGTMTIGAAHPDRFAALWSVAAPLRMENSGTFTENACNLADKPIWLMHGTGDTVVPVDHLYQYNDILTECGAQPRMTLYPNMGHEARDPYSEQEVYTWLLSHSLNSQQP